MQQTRPGGAGASRAHAVVSGERCASPARFRGPQRGEVPWSGTEGQWSHRACLQGAGLAPGVSRGVPWGLPESPSSEEQGLRPTGTAQESRDMEVWEMQTPRHRLPHNVAVLTSEFLPRPQFVHLGNKPPPPTPPHLRDPRALARPPGVTLRLNTTLSASLTTDRTSPLTVNDAGDAGDGSPDPGVRQAWPRRPRLLHPDPQRASVGPSQDFWETRLPPWDAALLPLP